MLKIEYTGVMALHRVTQYFSLVTKMRPSNSSTWLWYTKVRVFCYIPYPHPKGVFDKCIVFFFLDPLILNEALQIN